MKDCKKLTVIQADLSDLTKFAMQSKQGKKKGNRLKSYICEKLALAPCGNGHLRGDSASVGKNTICPDISKEKRRGYFGTDIWFKCKRLCVRHWAGRKWKCCDKKKIVG